ncbi:MAG: Ig-like domain-containing protein [Deltaproteobacteria bacterium]|nr:Ig-like domain-containing protein [Deltaproteobacteria bacterium]
MGDGLQADTEATLTSLTISPTAWSTPRRGEQTFHANATFSDNSTRDVSQDVSWSSADPNIVVVDNTASLWTIPRAPRGTRRRSLWATRRSPRPTPPASRATSSV